MKISRRIEVVRSNVTKLSSMGIESATAIVESLSEKYTDVVLTMVNTTQDLQDLITRKPDLVFLGMMHVPDPDDPAKKIWMSQHLEDAGIPHTGSTQQAPASNLTKTLPNSACSTRASPRHPLASSTAARHIPTR